MQMQVSVLETFYKSKRCPSENVRCHCHSIVILVFFTQVENVKWDLQSFISVASCSKNANQNLEKSSLLLHTNSLKKRHLLYIQGTGYWMPQIKDYRYLWVSIILETVEKVKHKLICSPKMHVCNYKNIFA